VTEPVLRSLRRDLITHVVLGVQPKSRRVWELPLSVIKRLFATFTLGEPISWAFGPSTSHELRLVKVAECGDPLFPKRT